MMAAEFPEYHEDKGQVVPPGRYVWTRQHSLGVWFHILFVIHPTADEFTVEGAWSFDGKTKPYGVNRREEFLSEAGKIRLGLFTVRPRFLVACVCP
jgi:hypothetical protein